MAEVEAHTKPGEIALVVCKKKLFDENELPREWSLSDRRTIYATHWGTGIGSNEWKDADVVFLFDEYHLSNHHTLGMTQGYRGHKATEGVLANMKSINEAPDAVVLMRNGHRHRWTMQMAHSTWATFIHALSLHTKKSSANVRFDQSLLDCCSTAIVP